MPQGVDVSRWLRYAIPGVLFEAVLGVWLYVDDGFCQCYTDLPKVEAQLLIALVAVALPLGFVASVLAHELMWARRFPFLARLDDNWILDPMSGKPPTTELDPDASDPSKLTHILEIVSVGADPKRELAAVEVDLAFQQLAAKEAWAPSVQRIRTTIDLLNGLAAAFCAVMVAGFTILLIGGWHFVEEVTTGIRGDEHNDWDSERFAVFATATLIAVVMCVLFALSQRRVGRIIAYFGALLLKEARSSDSP